MLDETIPEKVTETPKKANTSELLLRSPHFNEIQNEPSANDIIAASSLKNSNYSGSAAHYKKEYLAKNLPLQQKLTLEQLRHFNRLPKKPKVAYPAFGGGPSLIPKKSAPTRGGTRKGVKSVPRDRVRDLNPTFHPSDFVGATIRKIRTKRGKRNSSKGTLSSGRSRSSTRSRGGRDEVTRDMMEFETKKYVKNVLPLVEVGRKKKNVVRLFSPSTRQKVHQGRFFEYN